MVLNSHGIACSDGKCGIKNWTIIEIKLDGIFLSSVAVDPVTINRCKLLSISRQASHTKTKRNLADESAAISFYLGFYCDRHSVQNKNVG